MKGLGAFCKQSGGGGGGAHLLPPSPGAVYERGCRPPQRGQAAGGVEGGGRRGARHALHPALQVLVLVLVVTQPPRFVDLVASAEQEEVQQYVANLLAALEHIHRWRSTAGFISHISTRLGIIHRDIKPSNFLYDRQRRRYDNPQ